MDAFIKDLKYGLRMLMARPIVTLVAVITLGLGIGANSAVLSVVNAVVLRPLPYKNPDQLVVATTKFEQQGRTEVGFSVLELDDLNERCSAFQHISVIAQISVNLTGVDRPERIESRAVMANFFELLGVDPILGRYFTSADYQPGITEIAVVSHALWQRRFGGDPNVIGQSLKLDGDSYLIVGVMPAEFKHPGPETDTPIEVWYPAGFKAAPFFPPDRTDHRLAMITRLKPGVTIEQAQEQVDSVAAQLQAQYPEVYPASGWKIELTPLLDHTVGKVRSSLWILLGAAGFVLLIACTNVANLLLARATEREQEVAIRSALGSGRGRLIRQFLTESVLLSLLGGALGFVLTIWGANLLVALKPADVPRVEEVTADSFVLLFTLGIAVLTGIVFGIYPAVRASRVQLTETLKESSRGSGGSLRHNRVRSILVVAGFAFTLVLLVGAGLLIRSLFLLQKVDPGFQAPNVLTMELAIPYPNQPDTGRYFQGPKRMEFYRQILDRIKALPGVEYAGLTSILPLTGGNLDRVVSIEGSEVRGPEDEAHAEMRRASPDYFRAMGIQLLTGRYFTENDNLNAPGVAIVNETMAKRFWQGDAIGKRLKLGGATSNSPLLSIVGIIRDIRTRGLDKEPQSEVYLPYLQGAPIIISLVARATGTTAGLARSIENEIRSLDSEQPVFNIRTMDDLLVKQAGSRRFSMLLFGIFAAVALLLAAVGIYGVTSYSVSQRTREIGIRMALGAGHSQIFGLVVKQGLLLAFVGIGIGLIAGFLLTRIMAGLLFGVGSNDPATFVLVSLVLALTALLASYIPARRAARVNPVTALRYQ